MLISGLNRFFERHGRKTFAIFTGMIIVSFVLYFSPGFDITHIFSSQRAKNDILPGGVSKEEFQNAVNSNLILISLQLGGAPLNEQFIQQMAYYKALDWAGIAKLAEERGFITGDKAVLDKITNFKSFIGKDGFDKTAYDLFIKNQLEPFRFNNIHLEDAIRKDIAQSRLSESIRKSLVVSDAEIEFEYNILNSKIQAWLFTFKNEDFYPSTISEQEIEAYFNANKGKYMTDARSKALVARFNYIEFEEAARKLISDENIESFYNSNKEEFSKDGKVPPIETVRNEIKERLLKEKTSELATKKAQEFAMSVYQASIDSSGKTIKDILIEKAKEQNIPLAETDFFDEKSKAIKNIGQEPEFAYAVSGLIMDQPLSDAIKGSRAAFVALLLERQDPRQAELIEVKEKVINSLKEMQGAKFANQKASEIALALTEKLSDGAKINDLDEFKMPNCVKLPEFTLAKPPESPYSSSILELSLHAQPGKFSEIRTLSDANIFIFVESKSLPENSNDEEFAKYQSQYITRKQNLAWFNFINSTQKQKSDK